MRVVIVSPVGEIPAFPCRGYPVIVPTFLLTFNL
jgi:hypothetical protein